MRRANLLLAAVVLGLSPACRPIPLYGSPVSTPGRAPLEVYSVEWWKPLVPSQFFESAPRENAGPAVDRDSHQVVVLTRDGLIRAFGPSGKLTWEFKTEGTFFSAPEIVDGNLFVAAGDGSLYALEAKTGKALWKYDAKEELGTTPVLTDGKLLVASFADTLYALDAKTGKWLWQYRRDTPSGFTIHGASRPAVKDGIAYVGFADGHLVALRIEDGSVKWDKALSGEGQFIDVDTDPVIDAQGRLYAASYKDGVFAVDPATGDTLWHTATAGITHLLLAGGTLFATGDQQLQAISTASGQSQWAMGLKGKSAHPPLLVKGLLLVPINDSLVYVEALTGKQQVSWDPGQGVTATPAWSGSKLYVLSNMGYLYALRLAGGKSG